MMLFGILFYFFPSSAFFCYSKGKGGHREIMNWLRKFLSNNWEEFQVEHLLHTQALLAVLHQVPSLGFYGALPLEASFFSSHLGPHCFYWSLALRRAWEYVCVVRALAPLVLASTSSKNINVLQAFHPLESSLPCLDSLMKFQLEVNLDVSLGMFKSTFIHLAHLSTKVHLGMEFKHL